MNQFVNKVFYRLKFFCFKKNQLSNKMKTNMTINHKKIKQSKMKLIYFHFQKLLIIMIYSIKIKKYTKLDTKIKIYMKNKIMIQMKRKIKINEFKNTNSCK